MLGRVLCTLVLMMGLRLQAEHQVDINRHQHIAKSNLAHADSHSFQDEDEDEDEDEDGDGDDNLNDDEDGSPESDHDSDDSDDADDGGSLAESNSRSIQTPSRFNNYNAALQHQKEEGLQFSSTHPIKVHWLWHQSMCLEADLSKNVHHERNIHIGECREPTPETQRFDYQKDTYQIRLHYDRGQYCLDRDGDNLIFNICKNTGNVGSQRFVFDAGTDHIRNAAAAGGVKCLEINAGEAKLGDLYVNGTQVSLSNCVASETNQKFKPANLIDFNLTEQTRNKTARGTFITPASAAQQPVMHSMMPQSISPYYPMVPQIMPPYYQQLVGNQRYPQYANPMMPAAMPQMVAHGAVGPASMMHEAAVPPHIVTNGATPQRATHAAPSLSKRQKSLVVSLAHKAEPHAAARSPMQDAVAIAESKAILKKASDAIRKASSTVDVLKAAQKTDHLVNEETKILGDSSSVDPLVSDDSSSSSGGDSMFKGLDHILGHLKKGMTGDVGDFKDLPLLPAPASSAEPDNALSGLSEEEQPGLPDVQTPTTDESNPQVSSIKDILGDLNQAGKDMAIMDKPAKDKASSQDDALSPGSLLETTVEVESGGSLLRRSH